MMAPSESPDDTNCCCITFICSLCCGIALCYVDQLIISHSRIAFVDVLVFTEHVKRSKENT
jgi:hypothetical protein